MYRDRFGHYPSGTGAAFWNALREEPDRKRALAAGTDLLFVCKRGEVPPGPGVCGYRGPRRPVTDSTEPQTIIAADMEGVSPPRLVERRVFLRNWGYLLFATSALGGVLASLLLARYVKRGRSGAPPEDDKHSME